LKGASIRPQDVVLTLYSAGVRYTANVPAVRFVDPGPRSLPRPGAAVYPVRSLESQDFSIRLPLPDDLIGARIEGDSTCAVPFVYTPVVQAVFGSHPLPEQTNVAPASRDATPAVAVELLQKPDCETPYAPAALARVAVPEYPVLAVQQGARGSTFIAVTVGSDGSVFDTALVRSSGNSALDRAARKAARDSLYDSAVFRCDAVAADLTVRADFSIRNFTEGQTQLSAQ
jgi:TonB family protein